MNYPNIFCSILEVKDPNERKEEILCAIFANAILRSTDFYMEGCKVYRNNYLANTMQLRRNQGVDAEGRNWFRHLIHYSYNRVCKETWINDFRKGTVTFLASDMSSTIEDSQYTARELEELLNLEDGKRNCVANMIKISFPCFFAAYDSCSFQVFNRYDILHKSFWENSPPQNEYTSIYNFLNSIIFEYDDLFIFAMDEFVLYQRIKIVKILSLANPELIFQPKWQSIVKELFARLLRDFISYGYYEGSANYCFEDIGSIYPSITKETLRTNTVSDLLIKAYEKSLKKETRLDYAIVPVLLSSIQECFPQLYMHYYNYLLNDGESKWFARSYLYCHIAEAGEFDDALFSKLKKENSQWLWVRVASAVKRRGEGYLFNNLTFWERAVVKAKSKICSSEVISLVPLQYLPHLVHIESGAVREIIQDRLQAIR